MRPMGVGAINAKMNNGGGNASNGKKEGPNLNMGVKESPNGGLDQKTMAALKLNSGLLGGEAKRANDIGAMMNMAGVNGNEGNVSSATVIGANNPNAMGGFPVQSNNMIPGSSTTFSNGGMVIGQYPSSLLMNINGFNNHPSPSPLMMNMNMQARHPLMSLRRAATTS
ncbi:hypothetical protein VNO80_10247 [Phaseolus coccineus]|uniref:Uncharacterized protein n=1 Tax=Phaseolus coccineus TaxID=3886 RepID=A0AAN9RJ95_PHACN